MNFSKKLFAVILLLEVFAFAFYPESVTATASMPRTKPTAFNAVPPSVSPFSKVYPFISASCDLAITKTMSPASPVASGRTVTFTLTITDVGGVMCGTPGAVSPQTTVTDNLPGGLSAFAPVSAPSDWTCGVQNGGALVSCSTVTSFQVSQPVTITFQATVTATSGTIQNCATVDNSLDHNSSNNHSCIPISISGGSPCDLQITKTISPNSVASGSQAMVTLTIVNVGQTTCGLGVTYPTTVTDNLPTGMMAGTGNAPPGWNCKISGSTVTCNTTDPQSSTIPSSTPLTITFPVTVSGNPGDIMNNCASVSNPESTPQSSQSCVQVTITGTVSPCSLSITKTATPASVQVGGTVTFTITVKDIGGAACVGPVVIPTTVNDMLPPIFSNPLGSGSGWTCTTSGLTVTCQTTSTLSPTQSSMITITANAATAGPYNNCADVSNSVSTPPTSQSCLTGIVTAPASGCIDLSTGTGGTGIADPLGTLDVRWQVIQSQPIVGYSWLTQSVVGPYSVTPGWPYSWYGGSLSPDALGLVGTNANWISPYQGVAGQHDNHGNHWPTAMDSPPGGYAYAVNFNVPNWPQAELTINGFAADNTGTLWLDNLATPLLTLAANGFSTLSGPIRMKIAPGQHMLSAQVSNGPTSAAATITGLLVIAEVCSPAVPSPIGCAPLYSTALIAWWRAEGDVTDVLGGHAGTWMNGVTAALNGVFAPGVIGSSFSFNGVNQYVLVPDTPDLRSSRVTVDAWVKTPISSLATYSWITPIVANTGNDQPSFAGGYELFIQRDYANSNLGHAGFMVAAGGYLFGSNGHPISVVLGLNTAGLTVADGTWHHMAGTYDGQTVRIYVDGRLEGSKPYTTGIQYPTSSSPLYIGTQKFYLANPNTAHPPFQGQMDDIEVWNRALNAGEIAAIFNAGSAGKCLTINGNLITGVPEFTAGWVILVVGMMLPLAVLRIRKNRQYRAISQRLLQRG